jgi:hypothetical protein
VDEFGNITFAFDKFLNHPAKVVHVSGLVSTAAIGGGNFSLPSEAVLATCVIRSEKRER